MASLAKRLLGVVRPTRPWFREKGTRNNEPLFESKQEAVDVFSGLGAVTGIASGVGVGAYTCEAPVVGAVFYGAFGGVAGCVGFELIGRAVVAWKPLLTLAAIGTIAYAARPEFTRRR